MTNPHIKQTLLSLNIVRGVGGIKTDGGFKEVLSKIAERTPGSNLSETLTSSASPKEVKIRQAVEKWRKKRASALT